MARLSFYPLCGKIDALGCPVLSLEVSGYDKIPRRDAQASGRASKRVMSGSAQLAGLDPRRAAFKDYYLSPESPTFGNAHRSALRAGFGKRYSVQILSPSGRKAWVNEIIKDREILSGAERNLRQAIDNEQPDNDTDRRIKWDASKFALKTLGRVKYAESIDVKHSGAVAVGVVALPGLIGE